MPGICIEYLNVSFIMRTVSGRKIYIVVNKKVDSCAIISRLITILNKAALH